VSGDKAIMAKKWQQIALYGCSTGYELSRKKLEADVGELGYQQMIKS
jgi:hypothetical protein